MSNRSPENGSYYRNSSANSALAGPACYHQSVIRCIRIWIAAALLAALASPDSSDVRLERKPVPGGAEILTIFGPLASSTQPNSPEVRQVPLVSILRDTL